MADFYLDHNVAAKTADLLNFRGHNAQTARSLGLGRAQDDELLLRAAQDRRIFVTHNWEHFEMLHDAWRHWGNAWGITHTHAGILIIPQQPHWNYPRAAQEIDLFLSTIRKTGYTLTNELYRWFPSRGWVQR